MIPLLKIIGHLNPSNIPYTTKIAQAKKLIPRICFTLRGRKEMIRNMVAVYPIIST